MRTLKLQPSQRLDQQKVNYNQQAEIARVGLIDKREVDLVENAVGYGEPDAAVRAR